jgi:putative membrane protein
MPTQLSYPLLEWSWAPSIIIGLVGLNAAYLWANNRRRAPHSHFFWRSPATPSQQAAFYLGSLIALIALCSPIDGLGDEYLFSAHMVQHMLLTYAAPPLWLWGTPIWVWDWIASKCLSRLTLTGITSPMIAFTLFNGVMWVWHIPAAYDFALTHEGVHIIEHLTFITAALIGWSPALLPWPVNPLSKPARAFYLFASTFPCTALAALLALSNHVLYPFYEMAPRIWGITALSDQQIGGLLMWLPGDMILMTATLWILARWLTQQEQANQ